MTQLNSFFEKPKLLRNLNLVDALVAEPEPVLSSQIDTVAFQLTVVAQTTRILENGKTVVDVTLSVPDQAGIEKYEARIAKQ